jgi:hypothetical protein
MSGYGVSVATVYIEKLKYRIFPIRAIFGAGGEEARCDCSDSGCSSIGKHPRITWSKEAGESSMWERWPDDGFGIVTGSASGLWVLDIDGRHGGFETLAELEKVHGALPPTVSVMTGSGGLHLYFAYPGPGYRNSAGALGPGLDTRGDGGYVVGAGSLHKSGRRYQWQRGPGSGTPMAPVPAWLLGLLGTVPVRRGRDSNTEKPGLHAAPTPFREAAWLLEEMLTSPFGMAAWMRESPDAVSREAWRGFATNIACAVLGHPLLIKKALAAFHEISSEYVGYSARETEQVFKDSLTVAGVYGPMSFEHMVRSGMPPDCATPNTAKNLLHAARLAFQKKMARP